MLQVQQAGSWRWSAETNVPEPSRQTDSSGACGGLHEAVLDASRALPVARAQGESVKETMQGIRGWQAWAPPHPIP
jgi:hypothetical protein